MQLQGSACTFQKWGHNLPAPKSGQCHAGPGQVAEAETACPLCPQRQPSAVCVPGPELVLPRRPSHQPAPALISQGSKQAQRGASRRAPLPGCSLGHSPVQPGACPPEHPLDERVTAPPRAARSSPSTGVPTPPHPWYPDTHLPDPKVKGVFLPCSDQSELGSEPDPHTR